MASVARVRCDEADRAMQVVAVIPAGEGFHPRLSIGLGGKTLARPIRAVFAGAEQGFGERVVIADPWAAVGRGDAQFLHCGFHRSAFHGAAVVGMQDQRTQGAALGQHRLPDQDGGQFRTFAFMHLPADGYFQPNGLVSQTRRCQILLSDQSSMARLDCPLTLGSAGAPVRAVQSGKVLGIALNREQGRTNIALLDAGIFSHLCQP